MRVFVAGCFCCRRFPPHGWLETRCTVPRSLCSSGPRLLLCATSGYKKGYRLPTGGGGITTRKAPSQVEDNIHDLEVLATDVRSVPVLDVEAIKVTVGQGISPDVVVSESVADPCGEAGLATGRGQLHVDGGRWQFSDV